MDQEIQLRKTTSETYFLKIKPEALKELGLRQATALDECGPSSQNSFP